MSSDASPLIVGEVLGRGSYGVVHRGQFRDEDVAIKVVPLDGAGTTEDVKREVELMRATRHASVVALITAFEHEDSAWLILELCSVGSVSDVIARLGAPFDEAQIGVVLRGALRGLAHLHDACRTVHRDIKAGNVLITREGEAKLADFGIAKGLSLIHISEPTRPY